VTAKPAEERLPSNVVEAGVVSFFADVSTEMLYPLTPIFLTAVLGAPVAVVGLIEGVAEAIASLAKPVAGRLSDRMCKRIPFLFGGYSLSALAKPVIALASTWPLVLVARSADRLGKGIRTGPRDALIADSVAESQRGRAFGVHRGLDTAGAVVGALLSLLLLWFTHGNLRLVIWLSVVPGLLSVAAITRLREPREIHAHAAEQDPAATASTPLGPRFRSYVAVWSVFAVTNSSDAFIILRAKATGLGTTAVVLLYVLYNIVYALASPRLGALSDRIDRRHVLVGGLVVFSAVYAGLAVARTTWQLVALFALYGLYIAATEGVGKAFAVDLVPEGTRAHAVGVFGLMTGVAALIASIAAGALWTLFGPWAAFALGSVGALLSATLLMSVPALRRT
jgi:MFS family permease